MFVDHAIIHLRAGKGGDGCVSFRREAFVRKGGPNGGNGGRGGSVIAVAEEGMSTLYDFRGKAEIAAEEGEPGGRKQCTGADGADYLLKLPVGTQIFNDETGEILADLKSGDRVVVAAGGRGGFGNEHFKSSTNQAPRQAEPGEPGVAFRARLELKLIADVGLVGLPNAGKSTLLKALTRANPKIGDYPFTTLSPQLGIAELDGERRIVIADIPGLIEGASRGAGLGHDFLRHIDRTRVIVHLLDAQPPDGSDPADNYELIRAELAAYSGALAEKPELICLNKVDLFPDDESREAAIKALCARLGLDPRRDVLAISGAGRHGLRELTDRLWAMLNPKGGAAAGWKVGAT